MAANIILPWSHRAFALMKRWALGTYHGLAPNHAPATYREIVGREKPRKNQVADKARPLHIDVPESAG